MSGIFGAWRNPWRYPEFMEYGLAFAGLAQTLIAWSVLDELTGRRTLQWTLLGFPGLWSCLGLLLAVLHLYGLWLPGGTRGFRVRLIASHASCAFWLHFVGTTAAAGIFDPAASPATMTSAALMAPYAAFVVCVRLWNEWQ